MRGRRLEGDEIFSDGVRAAFEHHYPERFWDDLTLTQKQSIRDAFTPPQVKLVPCTVPRGYADNGMREYFSPCTECLEIDDE